VIPVYECLAQSYSNLEELAQLTGEQIKEIIRPLGLAWRAPLLYKLFHSILNDYEGTIPQDIQKLVLLPGVGDYIAAAYLSLHRKKRYPIIDSNVVRIYARFFGHPFDGETRRKKWLIEIAETLTPSKEFTNYNYALIDFGRKICTRKPLCQQCPLSSKCLYYSNRNLK
jgi:A/G-specific adenine glycosylase